MHSPDKTRVIAAISKLGGTVTAADVATETGLSPDNIAQDLNIIAWETDGRLQVSKTGDIAYSFPQGFAGKYLSRGVKLFAEKVYLRFASIAYAIARMSFGLGLMLSFGIIVVIVAPSVIGDFIEMELSVLLGSVKQSSKTPASKKKSRKSDSTNSQSGAPNIKDQAKDIRIFLEKCYSFLFGDFNPTVGLEEKRWSEIAKLIRQKHFALVSNELAPFTGGKPDDDSAALPVLIRFNGKPEVTDSGTIVYVFPTLQSAAAASNDQEHLGDYFEERLWVFSGYPEKALQPVHLLAAANLLGSWGLWIYTLIEKHWQWPPLWMALLLVYGTAFVAWPLTRWNMIQKRNTAIATRNAERKQYALNLKKPDEQLKKKLLDAEGFKLEAARIDQGSIVYSTDKNALDQPDELSEQFNKAD